ncbi:hypothetical protein RJZ57_007179, partial [Blastomyces gilchristii]
PALVGLKGIMLISRGTDEMQKLKQQGERMALPKVASRDSSNKLSLSKQYSASCELARGWNQSGKMWEQIVKQLRTFDQVRLLRDVETPQLKLHIIIHASPKKVSRSKHFSAI